MFKIKGKKISGFPIKGTDMKVDVFYFFKDAETSLSVTICSIYKEYFKAEELMNFLVNKGVIKKKEDWRLRCLKDTSGLDLAWSVKKEEIDDSGPVHNNFFFTSVSFDKIILIK